MFWSDGTPYGGRGVPGDTVPGGAGLGRLAGSLQGVGRARKMKPGESGAE